jgi:HPt (histidine-containing phosphotransfer) domain-containing protein
MSMSEKSSRDAAMTVEIDAELADLVPRYLSNRRADLHFARELRDGGDFVMICALAHRIKGTAASYGFVQLGGIAAALEQAAALRDMRGVDDQLDAYDAYLHAVRIEYI